MYRYFKQIGNTDHILSWKSKGLSNLLNLLLQLKIVSLLHWSIYMGTKIWEKFTGSCLKQDKVRFTHG